MWVHSGAEDKITFWPPLHLQRQAWALGVLQAEGAASVLDIGCGEGSLIQALCSPSPTIQEESVLASTSSPEEAQKHSYLHVKRLGGLDLDPHALNAITLPPNESDERWTPLEVDLWEGDLRQFNEELNDYQCMVALEVIENLEQKTLERFGEVVLGEYRPSLVLITTPNYDFNQRFDREGEEQKGWKDPTGRTERVFRHDDHKFEWTPSEFSSWCQSLADEFGYTSHPTLIGAPSSSSPSPPAPTPTATHATNACLFRLNPLASRRTSRSPRSFRTSSLPFLHSAGGTDAKVKPPETHHRLVTKRAYEARPDAGKPSSGEEIREALRGVMRAWEVGEVGLEGGGVWREMRGVCGGSRRALVQALGGWGNVPAPSTPPDEDFDPEEWELFQRDRDGREVAELVVRWNRFEPPAPEASVPAPPAPRSTHAGVENGSCNGDDGGWGA